jgi:hypothetical protein
MSHNIYDNRHYVIISSGDASLIDFNQVMETSIDTIRYSVDGTQTFVKYNEDQPSSVANCSSKSQEYSHSEILAILATSAWTDPNSEI